MHRSQRYQEIHRRDSAGRGFRLLARSKQRAVEAVEPTLLRLTETSRRNFARLLLPLWGLGQISLLLGAVDA